MECPLVGQDLNSTGNISWGLKVSARVLQLKASHCEVLLLLLLLLILPRLA